MSINIFPSLVNSFKLNAKNDNNDYNSIEYCKENYGHTHGQIVTAYALLNESYTLQFQSNYTNHIAQLKNAKTGATISVLTVNQVFEGIDFNFYEVEVEMIQSGDVLIEISEDTATDVLLSDTIKVLTDDQADTEIYQHFEFSNYQNTGYNYFESGFKAKVFLPVQSYKRQPSSTRTYFKDSAGFSNVLESTVSRKINIKFYFLAPSLIEMLSANFTVSDIKFRGGIYVSEEGLNEIEYFERYSPANCQVVIEEKKSFVGDSKEITIVPFQRDIIVNSIDVLNGIFLVDFDIAESSVDFLINTTKVTHNGEELSKGFNVNFASNDAIQIERDVFKDDIIVIESKKEVVKFNYSIDNDQSGAIFTTQLEIAQSESEFNNNDTLIELNGVPLIKGVEAIYIDRNQFQVKKLLLRNDIVAFSPVEIVVI